MTIGQRIARKRKELNLSQEALGEQLGVSRQAIYKWESDAALPEIDKLIALSRLFGVSVGALLGVEEPQTGAPAGEAPSAGHNPSGDGELTERQLNMVEEIVERYIAAQPKPKRRRRWPWVLAGIVLFSTLFNLYEQLEALRMQQTSIHNNISLVERSVTSQIDGISNRVEEILKDQNSLTAEYGTEISHTSLERNSVVFNARVIPRTYVEGMTVQFSVDNGTGNLSSPHGELGPRNEFTATLNCQLTDSITISAAFIYPDGTQETQVLDTYSGLYSASMPTVDLHEHHLFAQEVPDGTLTTRDLYITTQSDPAKALDHSGESAAVETIQVGLFRNQKLLAWAEPCEKPDNYGDHEGSDFYRLPDMEVENLTKSDVLAVAALVTDTYGRQFMACDVPYVVQFETDFDHPYLTYPPDGRYDADPANWDFEPHLYHFRLL